MQIGTNTTFHHTNFKGLAISYSNHYVLNPKCFGARRCRIG